VLLLRTREFISLRSSAGGPFVMRGLASHTASSHATQLCPLKAAPVARSVFSSGTQRPRRKQFSGCRASARQPDGAEGEEAADYTNFSRSLNDEWQKRRSCGDLYHSLAEQDRHWAAGHLESFTSIELDSSITTTLDDPRDMDERLAHSSRSWGARSITYSPNPPQPPWSAEKGSTIFVILFGVGGSTDSEGIYSLRVMSLEEGLPQDTIIAFSAMEDAQRYAGFLEAMMEHTPTVIPIEPNELVDFCSDHGYSYRVEAIGSLLIPPNYYVGITDWERALRLREGKYTVQEREQRDLGLPSFPATSEAQAEPMVGNNANFYPLSSSTLEEQRAMFERLAARD